MKITILLISMILSISLLACTDKQNILVEGVITSESSGNPIANADITIVYWYGVTDVMFKHVNLKSDSDGKFLAQLEKGYRLGIAAKAKGFEAIRKYVKSDLKIICNFSLKPAQENYSLKALLGQNYLGIDESDKAPFLRVRYYYKNSSGSQIFNSETYGFDFNTFRMKSDTTECDLWFRIPLRGGEPLEIFSPGGIIPIYSHQINSSIFFEQQFAPVKGYLKIYKLLGNEVGLFILCRDGRTFGKIIFESLKTRIDIPIDNDASYEDIGIRFSALYDPTGSRNFNYQDPDLDLKNFLIDARIQ